MRHKCSLYYCLALLCCLVTIKAHGQFSASFTGSGDFCSGGLIDFSSSVTGGTSPYTYAWNFAGQGASTVDNPSFAFTTSGSGCGIETFNVTLTVTDASSQTYTASGTVSIGQLTNIEFIDANSEFYPFNNCNSSSKTLTVALAPAFSPGTCITSYEIDWGDGSSPITITNFPLGGQVHSYITQGIYELTVTAIGINGCRTVRSYEVINETNAVGGMNIPGHLLGLCAPADTLKFYILDWMDNSSSTSYTIDYGDGTIIELLHTDMLLDIGNIDHLGRYYVPHAYTEPSCPDEYIIRLTISNVCGEVSIATGTRVAIRPEADFTGPPQACVNTPVTFINNTDSGYTPNCNRTAHYYWNFGDGAGATYTNQTTPPAGIHTYTTPGTYMVSLIVANSCGRDTSAAVICIEPQMSMISFDLGTYTTGCVPMTIHPINTSTYTSICTPEVYMWIIGYTAGPCGTGSSYTFLGGTNTIQFLNPGSYHLRLAVENACRSESGIQTVTVLEKPVVSIPPMTACQTFPATGFSPNAAVLDCTGNTTYSWNFPGGSPTSSSVVSPTVEYANVGAYTMVLTVTNSCGSAAATTTATVSSTPIIDPVHDQAFCNETPVNINFSAATETGTVTYNWTNSNTNIGLPASGTGNLSFTAANTTTVPISGTITVTPIINSCIGAPHSFTITVLPAPEGTIAGGDTVCMNSQPVLLTFTGSNGTPPYIFSYTINGGSAQTITSGSGNTATIAVPTTATGTFTYTLTGISDSGINSCANPLNEIATVVVVTHSITVHPLNYQQICSGRNVETLEVIHSGPGTPTYQWYKNTVNSNSGGATITGATAAIYLPPAGDFTAVGFYYYYVVITFNIGNCNETRISNVAEIEVIDMPPVSLTPEEQAVCQDTPAIIIEVVDTSGNPSYTYEWYTEHGIMVGTGSTYEPPTNIVGTQFYYYIVTELYPVCTITSDTAYVTVAPIPSLSLEPQSHNLCEGEPAPTLVIAYENGAGTPNIQWYANSSELYAGTAIPGATLTTYTPPVTHSGTTYYYCEVTFPSGNCGSLTSNIVYVTVHPTPVIDNVHITNVPCYGGATGAIALICSASYTYTWIGSGSFNSNQQNITSLFAGTYQVFMRSIAGCTYTAAYTITQPPDINISTNITPITCHNANDGIVHITVTGGVAPYTAQWNDLIQGLYRTDLMPGTYTVTVVDANNCAKTITINMEAPPIFSIAPHVTPISCYGANDATINLNFIGGEVPITCVWDDDPTAGAHRINLPPGTYFVRIADSRPCFLEATFHIIEPMPLNVSAIVDNAFDCIMDNSGAINLFVTGGTAPYTYVWSNGATTQNLSNIHAGNYRVEVIDAHGCRAGGTYTVIRPPEMSIDLTTKATFDCFENAPAQLIIANATGGIPPYTYTWSTGTVLNHRGDSMITTTGGIVIVTVTDLRGCSVPHSFEVSIPQYHIWTNLKDCNQRLFEFDVIVEGDDIYIGSYLWHFGDGQTGAGQRQEHNYSEPGVYIVTLEQILPDCSITQSRPIIVPGPPNVTIYPEDSRFCMGDSLVLTAHGADMYQWNNNTQEQSITIYTPGYYSVTGINLTGCTNEKMVYAEHFPFYDYRIQSDKKEVTRLDPTVEFWSANINQSFYTWSFDGYVSSDHFHRVRHTYMVTEDKAYKVNLSVINPHGCLEYDEATIHANVVLINTFTPNNDGVNDTFMEGWKIEVYNRNGQLFYKGDNGWDGTHKGGKPAAKDTYFYIIYDMVESGVIKYQGYITLIR